MMRHSWIGELMEGFQDVTFLPSWASFATTFLNKCDGGDSLWTATCLKSVVGGKQGHAPCKMLFLQQSLFLRQSNLMEIIRL